MTVKVKSKLSVYMCAAEINHRPLDMAFSTRQHYFRDNDDEDGSTSVHGHGSSDNNMQRSRFNLQGRIFFVDILIYSSFWMVMCNRLIIIIILIRMIPSSLFLSKIPFFSNFLIFLRKGHFLWRHITVPSWTKRKLLKR